MDGVFSITQLTSMASVVGAAVGLTWVVKRILGNVRVINCIPVWFYTSAIAGVLAYVANRVTGTLPGVTGTLVVDALVLGAAAAGVRDWAREGITKPMGASETAIQAREGTGDGSIRTPRGNMGAYLLPLLLVSALAAGAVGCGGTFKPPVITPNDQAQVQELAVKALAGIEVAGIVMRDGRQLVSDLERAGVVARDVRTEVNAAVIRANDDVIQPVITHIQNAVKKTGQLATLTDVKGWAREGINAFLSVARVLEKQADARLVLAGRFIRSALETLGGLVGVDVKPPSSLTEMEVSR